MTQTISSSAQQVLRDNDRGGYCVPTGGLYPFQWMWDSGFTALGWQTFDEARAWQEIQTIFRGQWADGMLPHIIFHKNDPGYFPGPDAWGTPEREPATSGITDPPVLATQVRELYKLARDPELALGQLRDLYPKLLAFHRWMHRYRDPAKVGLITMIHPWETGEDNSPTWDGALADVQIRPDLPTFVRRDTAHVDASQRPKETEYQRYMTLVHHFRDQGYDPARVVEGSPFKMTSPGFNSIMLRADRDLQALAAPLGEPTEEMEAWIELGEHGLETLWNGEAGMYQSRNQITGKGVSVVTSSCFEPLYAGNLPAGRAEKLAARLEEWGKQVRYLVPSTDPSDPLFESRRYWRGPVWAVVNWMIEKGLREHGFTELADRVRHDTLALIHNTGYFEYFDPISGEGLGGDHFTWTAAIALAWGEN